MHPHFAVAQQRARPILALRKGAAHHCLVDHDRPRAQRRFRPRVLRPDRAEQLKRVVADRILHRRKDAKRQGRVHQAVDRGRLGQPGTAGRDQAQRIAGEQHHAPGPAVLQQPLRVAHVGRGEQVRAFAPLDPFAHQAGKAEGGLDRPPGLARVGGGDLGQHLA